MESPYQSRFNRRVSMMLLVGIIGVPIAFVLIAALCR